MDAAACAIALCNRFSTGCVTIATFARARQADTRVSMIKSKAVGGLTAQVWQAKLAACKTLASCLGKEAKSTDKKRRQYKEIVIVALK